MNLKDGLFRTLIVSFILTAALLNQSAAQPVIGKHEMNLRTPVTEKLRKYGHKIASDSLRTAIHRWIDMEFREVPDTSNPVERYFFKTFVDSCISSASSSSLLEGNEWEYEVYIQEDKIKELIRIHNNRIDSAVESNWEKLKKGQKTKEPGLIHVHGIKALFFAHGSIGRKGGAQEPEDTKDKGVSKEMLIKEMNNFFSFLSIDASSPVIKGRPSFPPTNEIYLTCSIDSIPVDRVFLRGSLPEGTKVFVVRTESNGTASLNNTGVPFTPRGNILKIRPDFPKVSGVTFQYSPEDLGLEFTDDLDVEIMVDPLPLSFDVDYTNNSVSDLKLPNFLAEPETIKKFLRDSCNGGGKGEDDISVRIQAQVSKYSKDETETVTLKMEGRIEIKQLSEPYSEIKETGVIHKKEYDMYHDIPYGNYFYEASREMKKHVKKLLNKL